MKFHFSYVQRVELQNLDFVFCVLYRDFWRTQDKMETFSSEKQAQEEVDLDIVDHMQSEVKQCFMGVCQQGRML